MEDPRRVYELDEGRVLEVVLTHEGVIMDAYEVDPDGNDRHVGTKAMMADEWWEYLYGQ